MTTFAFGVWLVVRIFVNGEDKTVGDSLTVAQLLNDLGLGARRVAVEVNREIVPRSEHVAHRLRPGDRIEVVLAVGGG